MQFVLDAVFHVLPLAAVHLAVAEDDVARQLAAAFDDVLVLAHVDEAAADDIRAGHQRAAVAVDGHDDDNQAVLAEVLAVAQDHVAHVADAKAIHQHAARGHLAHDGQAVLAHLDDLTDLRDDDVFRPGAQRLGQLRVLPQLRILAVDGQEILRLDQRVQELDLLLAGVAGDVHLAQLAVDDVGPAAVELVDDPRHGLFIAGDGVG